MSTINADRALLVSTFEACNASINWPLVRAAFQRIGRNEEAFKEARLDIRARGVQRYLSQAGKFKRNVTVEQASTICLMVNAKGAKPNEHGLRSALEEQAFKSGTNAWDYMVKTAQYVPAGVEPRGAKRKPRPASSPDGQVKDAPTALPATVIPKANKSSDVNSFYLDSVRPFLVKAQAINASLFTGAKGNAILAAHTAFVNALNAASELGDE